MQIILLLLTVFLGQQSLAQEIDMHVLKNKAALSTVVATPIVLVVSALLATVVTFYAINVATARVQEEALFLTKHHVWYNTSGSWAQAAMVIVNTGEKMLFWTKSQCEDKNAHGTMFTIGGQAT